MPVVETLSVASLTRLLQPLLKDMYDMAKKVGVRGLKRWEQSTFPSRLAKRIKTIDQVRTIWKPEGPISLQEFFHPPRVIIDAKPIRISRIAELPGNAIIIEGIVGQGKSVFLKSLAIEELTHNDGKWLPMFLELKDLSQKFSLRSAILKQLDSYCVDADDETLDYLFSSGKFALLLDGFDELEEVLIKETHLEMEHLSQKYPDLRIVVTSRPGHEIQKSTTFQTLPIARLTAPEYSAFMDRLGVDAKKSLSLRQAIRDSQTKISDLITTPLMLTLVVLVYESESEIPETLPEFFECLFQVVFTKHDRQKANFNRKHKSGLSERSLQKLFESFSFMTLQSGHARTLSDTEFAEMFEMARESEGVECGVDEFRHDITKSACLMLEDGIDSLTYLHKSLLEYFAAAFVKRLSDENAQLFYNMAMEKYRPWQEVLVFLKSIDATRYARYYVLPIIKRHREGIIIPCIEANDNEIVKFMARSFSGLEATYSRDQDKHNFSVRVVSFGLPMPGEEIGNFSRLMLNTILDNIPSSTKNLLEEFGSVDASPDPHSNQSLNAFSVFSRLGAKEIRSALGIFETRLSAMEVEAAAVISKEEKKKLLFVQKNS